MSHYENTSAVFCGNLSSKFWDVDSIGFCTTEAALHLPISLLWLFLSLLYSIRVIPFLDFRWPFAKVIIFRIFIDVIILSKTVAILFLTISSNNLRIIHSAHLGSTIACFFVTTLFDFLHSKANWTSSRGPNFIIVVEILYFYIAALQSWSGLRQFTLTDNRLLLFSIIFDVVSIACHLLSKIPVVSPTENERRRDARLLRQENPSNHFDNYGVNVDTESSAGCCSQIFFTWINSTINKGFNGELFSSESLPPLSDALKANFLASILTITGPIYSTKSKFKSALPLIKAFFANFKKEFLILSSIKFAFSLFSLLSPIFLNKFITELTDLPANWKPAVLWGAAIILSRLLTMFISIIYDYWIPRFGFKAKVSIACLVYRQILKHKTSTLSEFSTGNLVNLLTSDTERIVNLAPSLNELWAMPVQVIIAIVLLYFQIGVSCLVGVAFLVALVPLNRFIASQIGKYSASLMHHKDLRVKFISEVLQSMTTVKLACWELLMHQRILRARNNELKALRAQKLLDAACVFLWAACPALLAGSTFAVYVSLGNKLKPAEVFTSIALFNMLIGPMNIFPWVINGVVEAWVSAARICRLFELAEGDYPSLFDNPTLERDDASSITLMNNELELFNSSFHWNLSDKPVLSDINLKISKGNLIGIVGPVASGKSSLLLALMGELRGPRGPNMTDNLSVAYVGLTPWLQQGTIRENILFGNTLEPDWLTIVLEACGLDLDLADMPLGLDTDVGEAGSRLSGGQKARVALARAVYQRADVYLLDDPLAALDASVARAVLQRCLGRQGLLVGKTRIIVTHLPEWLFDESGCLGGPADLVITLHQGKLVHQWTPGHQLTDSNIAGCSATTVGDYSVEYEDTNQEGNDDDRAPLILPRQPDAEFKNESKKDAEKAYSEKVAFGSISSHVYKSYIRAAGYCLALCVVISLTLMQASRNGVDYWLSYWMQQEAKTDNATYLSSTSPESRPHTHLVSSAVQGEIVNVENNSLSINLKVYIGIIGANLLFTVVRAVLFAYAGLAASSRLHKRMLDTVLQAEIHFFESTPLGRILNRFSSDVGTIDDGLPFLLNIFLATIFALLGSVIVTCFAMPAILIICLPLVFVYWSVQRVYRAAARDLKRLSSIARSPVYAHFSETIAGRVVIRGFHKTDAFEQTCYARLNDQTRCDITALAASAWLNLRLQSIAQFVVTAVIATALLGRVLGYMDVSLAGLAVIYALMLANLMTSVVSGMTDTEKDFVAVERCCDLIQSTPVEVDIVASSLAAPRRVPILARRLPRQQSVCSRVDLNWPSQGRIAFCGVHLTYPAPQTAATNPSSLTAAPSGERFALEDVNLEVEAGDRVGIVGRTGSGKSSLLRVLFRLTPHLEGPVSNPQIARSRGFRGATGTVTIDDVDVREVPLHILRSRTLCISQEPFLFSGTVRENLDPDGLYPDTQLVEVLHRCGLTTTDEDATCLLSTEVGESGRSLSAGQRQLLCLARALFHQTPSRRSVICLDEATSALDEACEEKIQKVLTSEFADSTVLLVAHRLRSVTRFCNRVVVMSFGSVVEVGDPHLLAVDPNSQFYRILHNQDTYAPYS